MHAIHQLNVGGAENGIVNLVNHIDPLHFESSICTFVGGGSLKGRLDRSRTKVFELGKKAGNDPTLPLKILKVCRIWQPHILHTHAWGTMCEGIIGAKLGRIPVIVHGEHGTIQKKSVNTYIQRLVWGIADQILSVSEVHKQKLAKTIGFSQERIKVIQNGVDTNRFSPSNENKKIRKRLGIAETEVVIATIGRLVPVKNQAMLIKAFSELSTLCSNTRLLLVGHGPLYDDLYLLARSLGLSSRVLFLGKRSDVHEILREIDIFVLSSDSEGMSNTILEAMSSGVPVIATNVGGNSAMVKADVTGLLVERNDVRALTNGLRTFCENHETRNEMGGAARRLVKNHFSLQAMIQNYENLYLELYQQKVSSG